MVHGFWAMQTKRFPCLTPLSGTHRPGANRCLERPVGLLYISPTCLLHVPRLSTRRPYPGVFTTPFALLDPDHHATEDLFLFIFELQVF